MHIFEHIDREACSPVTAHGQPVDLRTIAVLVLGFALAAQANYVNLPAVSEKGFVSRRTRASLG